MAEHTPGPWRLGQRMNDGTIIVETGATVVAQAGANDARLIAAAPRMLDALRDAHGILQTNLGDVDPHVRSACDLMWAAIMEATDVGS